MTRTIPWNDICQVFILICVLFDKVEAWFMCVLFDKVEVKHAYSKEQQAQLAAKGLWLPGELMFALNVSISELLVHSKG